MPNKNKDSKSSSSQKTSANTGTSQQQASQSSGNTGSSSNTGSTMPQSQQGQSASVQPTGHHQQHGQGRGQAHVATGGQFGQPAATQPAQISLGSNTLQSATSAQGQQAQYPQPLRWRNVFAPGNPSGNNQGATGQGGSSSTNTSGMGAGAGAGAGAYVSTMFADNFRYHRGGGGPPNRGTRGPGRSRGQRG